MNFLSKWYFSKLKTKISVQKKSSFMKEHFHSIGKCLYISDTLEYLFSAQSFTNPLYENSSPIVPSVIAELFTYHCGEQVLVCEHIMT